MLLQTALVFWFWAAVFLSLTAGCKGLGLALLADLLLGWSLGVSPLSLGIMGLLGIGALLSSFLLGRRYSFEGKPAAAAGLGFTSGVLLRPVVGLLAMLALPVLVAASRPRRQWWLALTAPGLRLLAAAGLGLWLLAAA